MMMSNKKEKVTAVKEGCMKTTVLMEFIRAASPFDRERMELVEEILDGLEGGPKELVKSQIYLYGSQIKAEELFARQLFLWLLGMLEERE